MQEGKADRQVFRAWVEVSVCEAYIVLLCQCYLHPVPHLEATRQAESRKSQTEHRSTHIHHACTAEARKKEEKEEEGFDIRSWEVVVGVWGGADLNWKASPWAKLRSTMSKYVWQIVKGSETPLFFHFPTLSYGSSLWWTRLAGRWNNYFSNTLWFMTIFVQNTFSKMNWLCLAIVCMERWLCVSLLEKQYYSADTIAKNYKADQPLLLNMTFTVSFREKSQ